MTTALWILLAVYLVIGGILALAYGVFDVGMSAGALDLGMVLLLFVGWLPYLLWGVLKLALLILLPMSLTNRLFPVKY